MEELGGWMRAYGACRKGMRCLCDTSEKNVAAPQMGLQDSPKKYGRGRLQRPRPYVGLTAALLRIL